MRSTTSWRSLCLIGVMWTVALLTGCATAESRLATAARTQAQADLTDEALAVSRRLPPQPADCRAQERSGVQVGDRLDVALLKTDRALGRANARVVRCAEWHDELRRNSIIQPQEDQP